MENEGYTPEEGTAGEATSSEDKKVPLEDGDKSPDGVVDSTSIEIPSDEKAPAALTPYAGMGKDDLLRFSQTTFWVRMRWACVIIFWVAWFGLLTAVVILTIVTDRCSELQEKNWWQKSTLYQVYVRSFYDTDGNGVGDIKGIVEKLDYIESLKVDGIVLSSIYLSHKNNQSDFGYDVIDHMGIDPELGTMADFDRLLEEAENRDIKVLLDFIPNHTGDQHPWFIESATGGGDPSNPYWNYYVWAECSGGDPTNWVSKLGGSAWEPGRGTECYLHQFFQWQPELNLRSPQVKDELEAILRFWLEKGVDGFRVRNVKYLFEDADMRNEAQIDGCGDATAYSCFYHNYTTSQSEIHDLLAQWRHLLNQYSDEENGEYRLLLTDADDTVDETMKYYGLGGDGGAHLPINYQLSNMDRTCGGYCVRDAVQWWLDNQPADTTADWLTGHQDGARLAGVMGDEFVNAIMLLKFTLPGVVLTYYGEELGMINGNISEQDPAGDVNPDWSRDPYRSPMQWSDELFAGFANMSAIDNSTYEPWLPVNSGYRDLNVEKQNIDRDEDRFTHLNFYRNLVELHRGEEGLHYGEVIYTHTDDAVFSFVREVDGKDRFLAAFNFGNNTREVDLERSSNAIPRKADVLLTTSSHDNWFKIGDNVDLRKVTLRSGDGVLFTWEYSR